MYKALIKKFFILICILPIVLSGCISPQTILKKVLSPFSSEDILPKEIIVSTIGTLKKQESLFSSYTFLSENLESFPIKTVDGFSKNLEEYVNEKVVIKGLISNIIYNKQHTISFDKHINLIDITDFHKNKKPSSWKTYTPKHFILSFSYPHSHFIVEEKIINSDKTNPITRIIIKYNDDIFFTISQHIDTGWKKKFMETGKEIQVGKYKIKRLFSGKQILFYIPALDIQIDYWGEKNNLHLFYSIIQTIQNISVSHHKTHDAKPESLSSQKQKPNLSLIIKQILTNPIQALENSTLENKKIIIDSIEYFGTFLSIEYKIIGNNTNESLLQAEKKKKLFSIKWKNIQQKTFTLQQLVEWERGEQYLWKIKSGNLPNIKPYETYFLRNIHTKFISALPKNFIRFLSPQYKYSIGYPKKMYYEVFKNSDTIEEVKWSNAPLQTEEKNNDTSTIILSVIPYTSEEKTPMVYTEKYTENTIIIPKSSSAYFVLKGNTDISFSLLQRMAKSITLY